MLKLICVSYARMVNITQIVVYSEWVQTTYLRSLIPQYYPPVVVYMHIIHLLFVFLSAEIIVKWVEIDVRGESQFGICCAVPSQRCFHTTPTADRFERLHWSS